MTRTAGAEAPSRSEGESVRVAASLPETPYKGLSFYSEEDASFFFGRQGETQVVTANLMASRLTLLYGESGVGKSSLLRAGVARDLHDLARENIRRRGRANFVLALFPTDDEGGTRTSWSDEPIGGIATAIERAVESLGLDVEPPSRSLPFGDLLAAWTELLASDLLIVLDQFEEYLLYHEGEEGDGTLETELPRALARPNLRASFLISIREDALARLDRFKTSIPTLFDNFLRINHLDQKGAREAIVRPIEKWNEVSGETPITIEPELVDTLLHELEAGRVSLGLVGVGVSEAQAQARATSGERLVETPYLQLVMTRLWYEETWSRSTAIRLATLARLGGCDRIVKTHLDGTMKTLRRYPRYVAARAFHHLVTPSGTKIAHNARDLADYVGLAEGDVEPVLAQLTAAESRILRQVGGAEGDDARPRYEIFHDVLAAPILDWRARYLRAREVGQSVRRGLTGVFQAVVGVVCVIAFFFVGDYEGGERTFFFIWALTALAMWVVATVVLVRRWRRRAAWVVPPVGALVAGIGPVTATIAAVNGVIGLWSIGTRRWRGVRARDAAAALARRRAHVRDADTRLRRFRGLTAIAGAGILALACIVPSVDFEPWDTTDHFGYRLLGGDIRLWFALEPIVIACVAGLIGVLLLLGRARRRLAAGVLAAIGFGALAFFTGYLFWPEAFSTVFPPDRLGGFWRATPRGGMFLGAAGGALILVAAAPASVVELFATMIGAGRVLRGASDHRPILRTTAEDRARRRRIAACLLALAGVILVGWGTFAPSGAWQRPADESLADITNGAAFQALGPASLVALAALFWLLWPPEPRLAAGLLEGWGVVLLALFVGIVGSAVTEHGDDARSGSWMGLLGGFVILFAGALALRETARSRRAVAQAHPPAFVRQTRLRDRLPENTFLRWLTLVILAVLALIVGLFVLFFIIVFSIGLFEGIVA